MEKEISFTAKIKSIEYTPLMINEDLLKEYTFEQFQKGEVGKSQFLVRVRNNLLAISRWVSPKRTRSYPYVRVYETLGHKNRITIIPLVKDEGIGGDRDFLQWDTVSLMSLLGVYVMIAYYTTAEPNPKPEYQKTKITKQEFDYNYLSAKIEEYLSYQSDALHWNLKQLAELTEVARLCEQKYYEEISPTLGIQMHNRESFKRKIKEIITSTERFKQFSREQAQGAQDREVKTIQPKELLTSNPKAKLTIRNYLGGAYYFTADECLLHKNSAFLIEKKHSKGQMPSANDIKDGIIKMILFTNLDEVKVGTQEYKSYPVLGLTAKEFPGIWTSWGIDKVDRTQLTKGNIELITELNKEAKLNGFFVFLLKEEHQKEQNKILGSIIGEEDTEMPTFERKQKSLDHFFEQ